MRLRATRLPGMRSHPQSVAKVYPAGAAGALMASQELGGLLVYPQAGFAGMWQDAAGTTPVTAVGQPVGRIVGPASSVAMIQATSGQRPVVRQDGGGRLYLETVGASAQHLGREGGAPAEYSSGAVHFLHFAAHQISATAGGGAPVCAGNSTSDTPVMRVFGNTAGVLLTTFLRASNGATLVNNNPTLAAPMCGNDAPRCTMHFDDFLSQDGTNQYHNCTLRTHEGVSGLTAYARSIATGATPLNTLTWGAGRRTAVAFPTTGAHYGFFAYAGTIRPTTEQRNAIGSFLAGLAGLPYSLE